MDEFAVFPLPEITSALIEITTHRSGFLLAPIRMTLNDLECPIQLKVCMSHGLLADNVDTSLASCTQKMWCSVKCAINDRAEKDACS